MGEGRVIGIVVLVVGLIMPFAALAHSGGTDSQGGHHNRRTGEYHFHHGRGPHQHPNGVCPYDSSRTTKTKSRSKRDSDGGSGGKMLLIIAGAAAVGYGIHALQTKKG